MSVGSTTQLVNTQTAKLFVRPEGSDIEYILLQDKNFNPSRNVLVEPSTSAGITLYSGVLNATLTGTLLFSTNMVTAKGGYEELASIDEDTLQLPIVEWRIKVTDFNKNVQFWQFKGMLENFELIGEAEGALKYSITIRINDFDASEDIEFE